MNDTTFPTRGHYLAVCQDCEPPLPMPFGQDAQGRDEWAEGHRTTGHRVTTQDPDKEPA